MKNQASSTLRCYCVRSWRVEPALLPLLHALIAIGGSFVIGMKAGPDNLLPPTRRNYNAGFGATYVGPRFANVQMERFRDS